MKKIRFIDLFAGLGATRLGFESACSELGIVSECVLTSEMKKHAVSAYSSNFKDSDEVRGDVRAIASADIPDFDVLLGGFPCQAFSTAGKRQGFADTRGTLFFEVERILKDKLPKAFILENVEGLVSHDGGNTLDTIVGNLEAIGYSVAWKVLDSSEYGVAQKRKRIYLVGSLGSTFDFDAITKEQPVAFGDVMERGLETDVSDFAKAVIAKIGTENLAGKRITDKRGGENSIHSWDIGVRGNVSENQKTLLNEILLQRRRDWNVAKGISWSDGMPLTFDEIMTFSAFSETVTKEALDGLVKLGYLKLSHPKNTIEETRDGKTVKRRYSVESLEKGYEIPTGVLSFPYAKFLAYGEPTPTITATDASKLGVVDGEGLRKLSATELKRLFGFPESYDVSHLSESKVFDLFGNTVIVPVIRKISTELIKNVFLS